MSIIGQVRSGDSTGRVLEVVLRGRHAGGTPAVGQSNRDAVGAMVTAVSDRRTRVFRKSIGEGNAAQNSERIRITLADGETLQSLSVRWPSGKVTEVDPLPAESPVRITE